MKARGCSGEIDKTPSVGNQWLPPPRFCEGRFDFFLLRHKMAGPGCVLMCNSDYLTSLLCGKCTPGLWKVEN